MLRIAICESDKEEQSKLLQYIAQDINIEDDYITECFSELQEVKKRAHEKDLNFDILFLMIGSKGEDSISLVEYIRDCNIDVDVIFLANNTAFMKEAFRCKAFNYIVKPLEFSTFQYEMQQYLKEKRHYQKEFLCVSIKGKEEMIPLGSVLYFVSEARRIGTFFVNDNKEIWFYGKMDELECELKKYGFLRCHQSYLINTKKIVGIASDCVKLIECEVPVSRKYMQIVKDKWKVIKKRKLNATMLYEKQEDNEDCLDNNDITIVKSLNSNDYITRVNYGIILGIRGYCKNISYRIYHEEEICIGRNPEKCQIMISDARISRIHCRIKFDEIQQCYYICDCSKNGTFVDKGKIVEKGTWIRIQKDTTIQLIDSSCSFILL